jgi:hypothetical protein
MAELNPLGSEKLQGDEKLRRILELTYYGNNNKPNQKSKSEFISEATSNGVYGIVKEKDGYYVKKGLNESSLDYIGGLFMKNKNRFSSYAEALKRLQLINGQDIQEATKYVLKQNSTQKNVDAPVQENPLPSDMPSEMPAEMPTDMPSEMPTDMPTDMPSEMPTDMPSEEPSSGSGSKPSDYMSEIQKFAGKLGQELRDQKEEMESDDIKYVLNMIISAVNLDKLEDDDIEEIADKFNRDEDFSPESSEDVSEFPEEEPDSPEQGSEFPEEEPDSPEDEELSETMDKLERFVNTPAVTDEEIDLSSYADIAEDDDVTHEIDFDRMKKDINDSIHTTLNKYFRK